MNHKEKQLSIAMKVIESLKGDREWQYVASDALAKIEEINNIPQ